MIFLVIIFSLLVDQSLADDPSLSICGDPTIGTGTVSLITRRRIELERFKSTFTEECAQRCACGCFGLVLPTPIGGRRYVCMNCHLTYHGNCKSRTDPRY